MATRNIKLPTDIHNVPRNIILPTDIHNLPINNKGYGSIPMPLTLGSSPNARGLPQSINNIINHMS